MSRALISLTLAASLGACVDNGDEGLFISRVVIPEPGCLATPSENALFRSRGQISMFSPLDYQLTPLVKSRILADEGQEDQRTVIAQGARIDLKIVDPTIEAAMGGEAALRSAGITRFETLFTAPITPNGGIATAIFDLIPVRVLDEIARAAPEARAPGSGFSTDIRATVVVYGDLAGAEVTSQPFQFPVTACTDCIINVLGACPLPTDVEVANTGNDCNPFQDEVVDCCATADGVLCPAQVASAAR